MNQRCWKKAAGYVALVGVFQLGAAGMTQAAAMPTSGSCGIEINRVLSGGDNAIFEGLANGLFGTHATSPTFDLSLMGVLDFTDNSWTMSKLMRQYTTVNSGPTDTVLIIGGTIAPGTATSTNPPGTTPLKLTTTGYVVASTTTYSSTGTPTTVPGPSTVLAPPISNSSANLLVMPVNGGKTLLIQNQTGGNGGGVCQF